jgi:hypothetical protein
MITASLRGRCGNMMFQTAAVIAHAKRTFIDYALPAVSGKRNQFHYCFQKQVPIIDHTSSEYLSIPRYREQQFGVYNPIPDNPHLCLQGYFQSEKYFKGYENEVKRILDIPLVPDIMGLDLVSIHVRRGDYLRFPDKYPQVTDKYLNEAMECFPGKTFLVFSDDLEHCRLRFRGKQFIFAPEPIGEKNDLGLMASCSHNIICNSTFSWWASYLNPNPNKMIIAPHEDDWFGEKYKKVLSAQDIMPKTWIKIRY